MFLMFSDLLNFCIDRNLYFSRIIVHLGFFFFFKQKTAYEMRISDWSSDVCSSDLGRAFHENRGCISVEGEPPPEEGGRIVERPSGQIEPRRTKLGLEAEAKGYPLRCGPGHHHDNGEDNGNQIGRASCREKVCQNG